MAEMQQRQEHVNFMCFFSGQTLLTKIGFIFWQLMVFTLMESQKISFVLRLGVLDDLILCKIVQCVFVLQI